MRGVFLAVLMIGMTVAVGATAQTVLVAQGEATGIADHGARAWLGLPYAAPPVGDLRWRPPVVATGWNGVRPADHFSADCRQGLSPDGLGPWTAEYMAPGPVSEDCLYLNVWAPSDAQRKLPVMVWIHGGAFTGGSGSVPIYNGAALAQRGVIVVTINYRVGVYGFLADKELRAEAPAGCGNYGLLDQIAALRWVKENIAAFGGDPERVTVAGQSAGAASVHFLISSPMASGLFQQAIAESGSGMGGRLPTRGEAEAGGERLKAAAGVHSVVDLRALSPDQLEAAAGKASLGFAPVLDEAVVTSVANRNDVPVLTGMTANETSSNGLFHADDLTPEGFRAFVTTAYGALAGQVLAAYPPGLDAAAARESRDDLARDRGLAAMDLWAEGRIASSHQPIYAYLWTHVEPGPEAERYKAFHSSEMPYVFGTLDAAARPFTAADRALSQRTGDMWAQFIKAGRPDDGWPEFGASGGKIVGIGDDVAVRPVLPAARLALFKAYVAAGGNVGIF